MSFMDFKASSSRLEKDAEKRRIAAKKKREREAKIEADLSAKQALDHQQHLERLAEQQLENERKEERRLREEKLTRGVELRMILSPYVLEDAEDDRVILPQSVLDSLLSSQNATSFGPMTFRLVNVLTGKLTHCGVREFTAPDNTIGLTPKIRNSLFPDLNEGQVSVQFVVLPKITTVTLQPLHNLFQQLSGVKEVLENNLGQHATLTCGDVVEVWFRGKSHVLSVLRVGCEAVADSEEEGLYAGGGSLFETDVEVHLEVSQEFQQQQEEEKLVSAASDLTAHQGHTLGHVLNSRHNHTNEASISHQSSDAPAEVPGDHAHPEEVITCKLKFPAGSAASVRLLRSNTLRHLMSHATHHLQIPVGATVQLATRRPNVVYSEADADKSFIEAGVDRAQEQFFVSIISPEV